jgi:glycine/D-amino acid oxidase-like deaminating enzyme
VKTAGEQQVPLDVTDEWTYARDSSRLPDAVDLAIVGGGIVGCSTAWFLARRGVTVALFEKGRIAGEQSGRNWGWVRQQGRDARELPLMIRSLQIWRGLGGELGEDLGFAQGGCLYLGATREELERHAAWLPVARDFGLDTQLLGPPELARVLKGAGKRWAGALYTSSDGRAEPGRATAALARGARRAGAAVFSSCAVRGFELSGGRIAGVVTEHGAVRTGAVLCAAGVWTRVLCRSVSVDVPQLRVIGSVARLAPAPHIIEGSAWASDVAIRRRADGGYTVAHGGALEHVLVPDSLRLASKFLPALRQELGGIRFRVGRDAVRGAAGKRRAGKAQSVFEATRVLAPPASATLLRETQQALAQRFPELGEAQVVERWAGVIEASPDVLPIISPVEALPGLHVATGFSGHGFGIGPAAGELAARMVTGHAPAAELGAFRLGRFFDGSPVRPGPSI